MEGLELLVGERVEYGRQHPRGPSIILAPGIGIIPSPSLCIKFSDISNGGSPGGSGGKESVCNVGDLGSISRSKRSCGEWNGYRLLIKYIQKQIFLNIKSSIHKKRKQARYSKNYLNRENFRN